MTWLNGITNLMDISLRKFLETVRTGDPGMLPSMVSQRVGHDLMMKKQQHIQYDMEKKKQQLLIMST